MDAVFGHYATREAFVASYRRLMRTTRAVVRDAETMIRRVGQRLRTTALAGRARLQRAQAQLQQMRPLVQRVLAQPRARILGGDTHVADKVLCLEPHTEAIRQGKVAKPTEFGKLVTIQEAEHQIVNGVQRASAASGRPHVVGERPGDASADLRAGAGLGRWRSRLQRRDR